MTGELIQGLEADWRSGPEVWWQHSGKADLPEFLARFGHRASNEFELAEPRWHENSEVAQRLLRTFYSCGDTSRHLTVRAREIRARAEQQLPRLLAAHGASSLAEKINRYLTMVHQLLPYREIGKHYLMLGYDLIRQVIVALADQLDLGGDIFFLRLKELQQLAVGESITGDRGAASLIERRRFRWQTLQRIALPNVVDRSALEHLFDDVSCNTQDGWTDATALSSGVARGPVYSVTDESTALDPQRTGYVLVCRTLDMGLTHLMTGACALVVERGGMLSHGAAVARQLGIPAVACSGLPPLTGGVTWLVVDGSRGRVRLERRA
jgi:pyruvate,water dikinase